MKRLRLPRNHDESGNTLVEVLVALSVIAIGLIASGMAMISALQIQNTGESRDKAVQLVQQQLEKTRQVQFTQLGFLSGEGNVPADPGYTPTAVISTEGYRPDATSAPCADLTTRTNCTVTVPPISPSNTGGLEPYENGAENYQTERVIPYRELLYDEAGGVGGVDYTIRTNVTWVDPASYGADSTLPLSKRPKKISVTVYWTEINNDATKVRSTTMSMIRTPNPGEWNNRNAT